MFFTHSFDTFTRPALLICEALGRRFWENEFGHSNCVRYDFFRERLMSHWRPKIVDKQEEQTLAKVLNFLLNFPQDGLVTTFKWDVFLGQWGAFNNLLDNLRFVALQPGFLGIMNGRQAEQVLTSLPSNPGDAYALIRFSSSSKTLSIAYMADSTVRHERKPPLVDLRQFLQSALKNRSLVPMSLNWYKISELQSLEDCVKLASGNWLARTNS